MLLNLKLGWLSLYYRKAHRQNIFELTTLSSAVVMCSNKISIHSFKSSASQRAKNIMFKEWGELWPLSRVNLQQRCKYLRPWIFNLYKKKWTEYFFGATRANKNELWKSANILYIFCRKQIVADVCAWKWQLKIPNLIIIFIKNIIAVFKEIFKILLSPHVAHQNIFLR